ncbi:hypothetical protein TNCV_4697001 [Trichonephila clavipes]|nr:hypothetical protein TNCV_4697001 [Trichonephila clavipes]
MKVTWCEISTVWRMVEALPTKSCNMVLRCGRLALSSNNRTPDLRSSSHFFRIASFNVDRDNSSNAALMVQTRDCNTSIPGYQIPVF